MNRSRYLGTKEHKKTKSDANILNDIRVKQNARSLEEAFCRTHSIVPDSPCQEHDHAQGIS